MKVVGKKIIVTGAGSGIGKELTIQLLRAGSTVIALDINKENLEKKGLVRREENIDDKRSKMVVRTKKGDELYVKIKNIIDNVYRELEEKQNLEHIQLCIDYMIEFQQAIEN